MTTKEQKLLYDKLAELIVPETELEVDFVFGGKKLGLCRITAVYRNTIQVHGIDTGTTMYFINPLAEGIKATFRDTGAKDKLEVAVYEDVTTLVYIYKIHLS